MFADDNENEENKKDSIPDDDMDRLLLEVDDEPLDEIGKEIVEQNEKKVHSIFFRLTTIGNQRGSVGK